MAVLIPGKLLFLAQQNTASMSVMGVLMGCKGAVMIAPLHSTDADIQNGKGTYVHLPNGGGRQSVAKYLQRNEPTMTVVRNPYDLIVTWYLRSGGPNGFLDFVKGVGFLYAKQYANSDSIHWHPWSTHTLRYESIALDLPKFMGGLRLQSKQVLGHVNATRGKRPWQSYHSDETILEINRRFSFYFVNNGYEMVESLSGLSKAS